MTEDRSAAPGRWKATTDFLSPDNWIHVTAVNADQLVATFSDNGVISKVFSGHDLQTFDDEYSAFTSAWNFTDYSGPSRGAHFHDSMAEFSSAWPDATGFAIIFTEPQEFLCADMAKSDNAKWTPLRASIQEYFEAAEWYAEGEGWEPDDPQFRPLSFDVVLVVDDDHCDEVVRRWQAAGAPLTGVLP